MSFHHPGQQAMSQNRLAFKSDVAALMNESELDETTKRTLVALFGKQAAATRCVQEDIRAVPEEASPATHTPRDSENPESEIQPPSRMPSTTEADASR